MVPACCSQPPSISWTSSSPFLPSTSPFTSILLCHFRSFRSFHIPTPRSPFSPTNDTPYTFVFATSKKPKALAHMGRAMDCFQYFLWHINGCISPGWGHTDSTVPEQATGCNSCDMVEDIQSSNLAPKRQEWIPQNPRHHGNERTAHASRTRRVSNMPQDIPQLNRFLGRERRHLPDRTPLSNIPGSIHAEHQCVGVAFPGGMEVQAASKYGWFGFRGWWVFAYN